MTLCMQLFFFNDTATTEIYTLSLHDALPISQMTSLHRLLRLGAQASTTPILPAATNSPNVPKQQGRRTRSPVCPTTSKDRKSTRLNSSHANISYAVFCLKKKKNHILRSHSPE